MSNDAATVRKQIAFKMLRLWNTMPDETLGTVLEEAFKINFGDFKAAGNKDVYDMLDKCVTGKLATIHKEKLHKKIVEDMGTMPEYSKHTSEDYVDARLFLSELKQFVYMLTKQEYQYLKGMALNGNIQNARNELYDICDRRREEIKKKKKR